VRDRGAAITETGMTDLEINVEPQPSACRTGWVGKSLAAVVSRDGEPVGVHYWNQLPDGTEVDLTGDQFVRSESLSEQRVAPTRPSDNEFQAHPGYGSYLVLSQRVRRWLESQAG
jgi:hypothetical protein